MLSSGWAAPRADAPSWLGEALGARRRDELRALLFELRSQAAVDVVEHRRERRRPELLGDLDQLCW